VSHIRKQLLEQLRLEWAEDVNGPLDESEVAGGSREKYWWRCSLGHLWDAAVYSRSAGAGCRYCNPRSLTPDRSLARINPELAAQWDHEANGDLTPDQVHHGHAKKVAWRCPEGPDHRWDQSPSERAIKPGCPYCKSRRLSVTNRLDRRFPGIAAEWHPTLNEDLTPAQVVYGAAKKVWWQCLTDPRHRPWPAQIVQRTRVLTGCPTCNGLLASPEVNLVAIFPAVAAQWHPNRNAGLLPEHVSPKSNQEYWWKCPEGPEHEWSSKVYERTQAGGTGCPFCSGHRACLSNCLATLRPELTEQWDVEANEGITPFDITPGSSQLVWWKCAQGPDHRWSASPYVRSRSGCPFCVGQQVSVTNCLATVYSDLAREWHPTKNDISSAEVTAGSNYMAIWQCRHDRSHEWPSTVRNRTKGRRCPWCRLHGRSRNEIYLAFELAAFLPIDHTIRHVQGANGSPISVDICDPHHRLIVEFDGAYWHQALEDRDSAKTQRLESAGWTVIRVREHPLPPVGTNVVEVQLDEKPHRVAAAVLHVVQQLGVPIPGVDHYQAQDRPVGTAEAAAYVDLLLKQHKEGSAVG